VVMACDRLRVDQNQPITSHFRDSMPNAKKKAVQFFSSEGKIQIKGIGKTNIVILFLIL
jgi:hypothetical protein